MPSPAEALAPLLCGRWDGCALWAQWSPIQGATYRFAWSWRRPGTAEPWSEWRMVERRGGLRRAWLVLPTWMPGMEIRAAVGFDGDPVEKFCPAREVTFRESRCTFEVSTTIHPFQMPAGAEVHAQVDGAGAIYRLLDPVALAAGGRCEVRGVAMGATGYQQLDHAGHLCVRPTLGVTIQNTEPSTDDVAETGRLFTVIEASLPDGPVRIAIGRRQRFS